MKKLNIFKLVIIFFTLTINMYSKTLIVDKIIDRNATYELSYDFDDITLKNSCKLRKVIDDKIVVEKNYKNNNINYRCTNMILVNNNIYVYGSIDDKKLGYDIYASWISKVNTETFNSLEKKWYISKNNNIELIKKIKNKLIILVHSIKNNNSISNFYIMDNNLKTNHIAKYEGIYLSSKDLIFNDNKIIFNYNDNNFSLTIGE